MTTKHTSDTFKTGDARDGLMARLTGAGAAFLVLLRHHAAIVGLVFLAAATPAQAIKLVSNVDQNGGASSELVYIHISKGVAQKFRTGSNTGGYNLTGIKVGTYGGGIFNVRICTGVNLGTGRSSGPRSCATLNRPANHWFDPRGVPTFTPGSTYTMSANKDYWVVMQTNDDRELAHYPYTWTHTSYQTTRSNGQTSEATQGTWSIGDKLRHVILRTTHKPCLPYEPCEIKESEEFEEWVDERSGKAARIRIEGTEISDTNSQTEAPRVTGAPALSEAGTDGTWTPDETVEVTLTWSEAVNVDTTGGTPSIGLTLGGTEEQSAPYLRGHGTTELVFGYTLTDTDGSHNSMLVPGDSLALNGGTIQSVSSGTDVALEHTGAARTEAPSHPRERPRTVSSRANDPVTGALVSNTGQAGGGATVDVGTNEYAQPFETGNNSGGYSLTGIVLDLQAAPTGTGTLTITVREDSSGSPVRTALYTLVNPAALAAGLNEFMAPPGNAELNADTTYWVVATYSANTGGPAWYLTLRRQLDAGTAAGWTISDDYPYKLDGRVAQDGWTRGSPSLALQIAVKGEAIEATTNNAPVFSPAAVDRSIAENTADGEDIGAAVTATDADDGDTLSYTLGGADMASFDIVETSGQIRTKANVSYDHETKSSYTVTVTATDGTDSAVATVTISVTDVDEPPDAPSTPTVSAVSGSAISLSVSWAAPANAGKPDIDDYDVQYRLSGAVAWTDGPQDVTGTTETISGLAADTPYEVQVRATNDEGDSGWSTPPGAGRTNSATTNNAPVFSPAAVDRSIAENTADGEDIGAAVTATDADAGDTLSYTLGGADMASFDIVETSGQIRTKANVSYDHETKSSYTVTVTATDGTDSAVATVTISVTDVDEPPDAPSTPTVSAVSGSAISLSVSWAAPANAGKPDIDDYDVQYRVSGAVAWSDGPQDVTGTTETISGLAADTAYEVQVRATNDEGDSGWSTPPGAGRTNSATTNNAPVFSPAAVDRSIAENTADGEDIGAAVTATDADDGDTLSYTLGGADMASFDIVETSGQIRTKANVSYDHEAKDSYTVTVTASDGTDSAVATVTISVTDVDEPPDAPATPTVTAVTGSSTSLTVSWAAPANAGKPDIDDYDVQYRLSGAVAWSDGPQDVTGTTETISGLAADTPYEVQVRATNEEGDSGWSTPPGAGRTNSATTNNAPVFNPAAVDRSIAENTADGEDIGAAVTATDADAGDTLSYTLGGADMASFDIVETSGQIRTKANVSYDHETKSSYTVTVTATDGTDSAVATVTISVTDVDEPPDAPSTPTVSAVSGSAISLSVSWAAPANAGKPDIDDYDVQYRVSGAVAWSDGPQDVTGTTETISGLAADTAYEVQVRATNEEGDSGWSTPPGAGRTNAAAISAPGVVGLTATAAAAVVCDDKPQYKRKQYGCVTLAWDEPVIDSRTVLERMEYRFAESGSALLWSRWQLDGTHSRTGAVIDRLELGTEYVFEVRAVILEGPGPAARTKIETPAAAAATGLISLHATQSDVAEGGALTFEVRRSANTDRDTFVLVAVTDTAFPGGNRLLGEDGLGMRVVKFKPGATPATGTVRVAFDGARPSSRTVTVSLQSVEEDYYYGTPTTLDIKVNDRDAAVSVRDAQVSEGPGATLEFAVTLDRALDWEVTVKYATSDGTAGAADYTATSGELNFAPGDTEKTVSVPVLDDVHDEGSETLTLRLSNPMGARIADAEATGTISNSDPLPKGWLSRFGRTSATQVVGLLDARFDEAVAPASQLTLGGHTLDGPAALHADSSADPDLAAPVVGAGAEATLLERLAWELLTRDSLSVNRRQFLSDSSFDLSLSGQEEETIETARALHTPGHWSMWGRGALTHLAGQDNDLSLDGDVLTGLLGLDYSRGRWLAGLGLAYNDGDGAYRAPDSGTVGKLDSTLVSVHPYLHYALTDRLSAWGALGYGVGGLSLRLGRDGVNEQEILETDIQMRMGALGLRGMVFANATTELALKSDLMWVRTTSSATEGLAGVDAADASRVRLLLTGRHRHMLATGAELTPNVELGLRYDDGDAETGAGVELGGGLRYADPVLGLTLETRARALLAHEDGGYQEWGLSGSLTLDPGRLGRGLSLRLVSGWGLTDSGTDTLWQQQDASRLTRGPGQTAQGRVKAEWAYGLDVPWTYALLTPYGSVEMAADQRRTLALGWRFELGQSLSLRLSGERREALHTTPEHALMLQTALPW